MTDAAPMDPLQALLAAGANTSLFPPNSRYQGLQTATLASPDGRTIVYVRRRFVPQPDRFVLIQEHAVTQGERVDVLAAQFVGDPEQFWRLCDANGALRPAELTESIGRRLRITLPEGIPGAPNV
jgi:hypothetical protein